MIVYGLPVSRLLRHVDILADFISRTAATQSRYVVAISGFGGSGKSTVSGRLSRRLNASIIHVDDFIAADKNGARENFPHDWQKLEDLTLAHLKTENEIVARIYDWQSNRQVLEKTRVGKYVIIEGSAGALIRDDFRAYFDLTVWIDVPADIAHARGKRRDRVEQGVDHDHLWDEVWSPLENAWFDEHRPDLKVDVLLSNDGPP